MFNFLNYNTPYMSGSQTSRNSYRPTQRGFDPFSSFYAEPEPVYYHEPRRTVHTRRPYYYDDEYVPRQTPVRNQRAPQPANRRAMNQSMAFDRPMNQSMMFEEPSLSQMYNDPRRVQRPQQRPQQQAQQPTFAKQPTQQRATGRMPQNTNTRTRTAQESDPFSFWDMFSADPFMGTSRVPTYRKDMAAENSDDDDENIVGSSSHTPVETMGQGPANIKKNVNKENDFKAANNMRQKQQKQQKAQPQAKPKASAQPTNKAEPAAPKVVQISSSSDPKDLVTIADETPAQQRKVEGNQPSSGLLIEEVNPQQS